MPSRTPGDCLSCEDRPRHAFARREQRASASCARPLPPETRPPSPAPPGERPSILAPLVLLGEQALLAGARAGRGGRPRAPPVARAAAFLGGLEHQRGHLDGPA